MGLFVVVKLYYNNFGLTQTIRPSKLSASLIFLIWRFIGVIQYGSLQVRNMIYAMLGYFVVFVWYLVMSLTFFITQLESCKVQRVLIKFRIR